MNSGDDIQNLISELLVRAGMLMEDHSVAAISRLPGTSGEARDRIRTIALGGAAIGALTIAACWLSELSATPPEQR